MSKRVGCALIEFWGIDGGPMVRKYRNGAMGVSAAWSCWSRRAKREIMYFLNDGECWRDVLRRWRLCSTEYWNARMLPASIFYTLMPVQLVTRGADRGVWRGAQRSGIGSGRRRGWLGWRSAVRARWLRSRLLERYGVSWNCNISQVSGKSLVKGFDQYRISTAINLLYTTNHGLVVCCSKRAFFYANIRKWHKLRVHLP